MNPCHNCIVLAICKCRFQKYLFIGGEASVVGFAHETCRLLDEYLYESNQEEINEIRILFGLEPYK